MVGLFPLVAKQITAGRLALGPDHIEKDRGQKGGLAPDCCEADCGQDDWLWVHSISKKNSGQGGGLAPAARRLLCFDW